MVVLQRCVRVLIVGILACLSAAGTTQPQFACSERHMKTASSAHVSKVYISSLKQFLLRIKRQKITRSVGANLSVMRAGSECCMSVCECELAAALHDISTYCFFAVLLSLAPPLPRPLPHAMADGCGGGCAGKYTGGAAVGFRNCCCCRSFWGCSSIN